MLSVALVAREERTAGSGISLVCPFPIGTEECQELRIDDAMPLTVYFLLA